MMMRPALGCMSSRCEIFTFVNEGLLMHILSFVSVCLSDRRTLGCGDLTMSAHEGATFMMGSLCSVGLTVAVVARFVDIDRLDDFIEIAIVVLVANALQHLISILFTHSITRE